MFLLFALVLRIPKPGLVIRPIYYTTLKGGVIIFFAVYRPRGCGRQCPDFS